MDQVMCNEIFRRTPGTRVAAIVLQVLGVTPHMQRLVMGGPEIAAWLATDGTETPAAWIKGFPPDCDPRAYTLRSVNMRATTIEIDFFLRNDAEPGTVSDWARRDIADVIAGQGSCGCAR